MNRIALFKERFNNYCKLSAPMGRSKMAVLGEIFYYRVIEGYNVEQYFRNEFYNYKRSKCLTFLSLRNIKKMRTKCIRESNRHLVDYKPDFNRQFNKYVKRDWVDLGTCSKEEYLDFVAAHPKCFCKVSDGLQGIGSMKLDFDRDSAELFYSEHKGKSLILEELIIQHHEMAEFNPSTVNTIRIATFLCDDGEAKVLGAALRTGRAGQIADNFHFHGIASTIDVEKGIVISTGEDNHFHRYVVHPDSGKAFSGFQIPFWNKILDEVKDAALVVPDVRYVGWDIAIMENDICFIEGNTNAAVDVIEMPAKEGIWPRLKPCVEPFFK